LDKVPMTEGERDIRNLAKLLLVLNIVIGIGLAVALTAGVIGERVGLIFGLLVPIGSILLVVVVYLKHLRDAIVEEMPNPPPLPTPKPEPTTEDRLNEILSRNRR
jgi:hypothetical protein